MDEPEQVPRGTIAYTKPDSAKDGAVINAGRAALVTANFLVAAVSGLIAIWAVGPGKAVLLGLFGTAIIVFGGQLALLGLRARERQRIVTFEFDTDSAGDVVVQDERNRALERVPAPGGRIRYRWSRQDPEPRTYSWQLRRIPS